MTSRVILLAAFLAGAVFCSPAFAGTDCKTDGRGKTTCRQTDSRGRETGRQECKTDGFGKTTCRRADSRGRAAGREEC
ncbi:MAG: hypothetical protein LBW85_06010, partial [Deltaproteobacteria bacterium]|nr:hypothetical protein [Deltaproteobacteria bacterium]